ncbi:MAG: CoA transferase [Alphaproteobacteria bacterium]|nr:CoA transferase [Alphaproteobacteria bacterium]
MKPLTQLKILDFTRVLSGPYCTALLADLGADVIKVEPPTGDDYRHIGPFLKDGSSALFDTVNRGKRSIMLDLAQADHKALALKLAQEADVLVENFRPGVAAKLGIGYAAVSALNPKLVYASISGFGQDGPLAQRPAYDIIIQAMSGLMSVTGEPDGPPMLVGESIADVVSGLFASWGILAALNQRHATGLGQHLDVGMLQSMLALQPLVAARLFASGQAPKRVGNRHPISAPFGAFRAKDGMFMLAVLNDKLMGALSVVMARPEILSDPHFATDELRFANEAVLRQYIEEWAMGLSAHDAVEALLKVGVPAAEILDAKQANELVGRKIAFEQPIKFSGATKDPLAPSPKADEHGAAIRNTCQWTKP